MHDPPKGPARDLAGDPDDMEQVQKALSPSPASRASCAGILACYNAAQQQKGNMGNERRESFGALVGFWSAAGLGVQTRSGEMIYRALGRTGERVSAIGLGGWHIGCPSEEQEGIRIIRTAIDRGITFLDNAWDYVDGKCEVWMGKALRDGYREKVFLMTKFDGRTKASTARQIDESLQRLQTDQVDLMQYHETIRMEDPDRFFAPDGPLEALLEARKAGKIRYIGFTGHKDPVVHLRMLELAQQHDFHFDAAQLPLNILDASFRSFAREVVPKLVEQGIAVLGMKPLAFGAIPQNNIATAIECLHYALSLPASVVITGCESVERLDQAFEAVRTFQPFTEDQLSALISKTREAALSGKFERFKTATQFDATALNPQWME
jgi:aryl-alcohol dehydrogenase-like predicted oxidoreductase